MTKAGLLTAPPNTLGCLFTPIIPYLYESDTFVDIQIILNLYMETEDINEATIYWN
jgi:hypothetical protein